MWWVWWLVICMVWVLFGLLWVDVCVCWWLILLWVVYVMCCFFWRLGSCLCRCWLLCWMDRMFVRCLGVGCWCCVGLLVLNMSLMLFWGMIGLWWLWIVWWGIFCILLLMWLGRIVGSWLCRVVGWWGLLFCSWIFLWWLWLEL